MVADQQLFARFGLSELVKFAHLAADTAGAERAALALSRLLEAHPHPADITTALCSDEAAALSLLRVLAASNALADQVVAHPDDWIHAAYPAPWSDPEEEFTELAISIAESGMPTATADAHLVEVLQLAYRRRLLAVAREDLSDRWSFHNTSGHLAQLAAALLSATLTYARNQLPPDTPSAALAIIALGKCGGWELNYVSDVDVIFVTETSGDQTRTSATATALAQTVMRLCGLIAWPVDAALRPEGKAGQLVRTIGSYHSYYTKWAHTWEFQALLKARPVAGDEQLGLRWCETIMPLIWQAADSSGIVDDVHAMRQRVLSTLPAKAAHRQLKLGPGGLRDVEFAVQLLQLVHGRTDDSIRQPNTLDALEALTDGGYVGREDGKALAESYAFLRTIEHRLQLQHLRRTHQIPDDEAVVDWLARSAGFRPTPAATAAEVFTRCWRQHAAIVRQLHEKLFYRPLLAAVATVHSSDTALSSQAAIDRLSVLGFSDPPAALRHVSALTQGMSRAAAIQRTLLPVILKELAQSADPSAGLLAYRTVSESLGSSHWYLRLLRDEGTVFFRLARILGSSRYVAGLIERDPQTLHLLTDSPHSHEAGLTPRTVDELRTMWLHTADRHADATEAITAVCALRRREICRIASADIVGTLTIDEVGRALADIADATLTVALHIASRAVARDYGGVLPVTLAIIAMGRLGGSELNYSSDLDVMVVYEQVDGDHDPAGAARAAASVVELMRSLLLQPGIDPPLVVDTNLRPEGRQGAPVRTLDSYRAYYERWSKMWEAQALLRARFCAGDADLGRRFIELVDPIRYPAGGLPESSWREIRRIKARIDTERLPKGADATTHVKLGRGGLTDIEWAVQLIQLRYGGEYPVLRIPGTQEALAHAAQLGIITLQQQETLAVAWDMVSRVRNYLFLVKGSPTDQLPAYGRVLAGVQRLMNVDDVTSAGELREYYLRLTRRAHHVVEQILMTPGVK